MQLCRKAGEKKSILENNYQQRCSRQCIILFFQMIFDKTRLHVHVNFVFRRLQPFVTAFIRMEAPALECLPRGFEGLPIFLLTQHCMSYCKPQKQVELTDLHLYHGYMSSHLIIAFVDEIRSLKLSFRIITYVNITLNALFSSYSILILYDG